MQIMKKLVEAIVDRDEAFHAECVLTVRASAALLVTLGLSRENEDVLELSNHRHG